METYVYKNRKKLRCGYTTGSCAAAAAKAAVIKLLSGKTVETVELMTPKGTLLTLAVQERTSGEHEICYAVQKDSGDDPDVTKVIMIYAKVKKTAQGITIDGGEGIGRVTKAGLACAVGEPAINPVPREMIAQAAVSVCQQLGYKGGLWIEISAPEGKKLAQRTFNPRLGIVDGISILGTSGIVEPMSEAALIDTIKAEMNIRKASGEQYILVTPGNYGEAFAKIHQRLQVADSVKCSNYLGEALDYAVEVGFKGLLLVGHMGKIVKVAGGIMNTHSRYADCRMEIIAAHSAMQGAEREIVRQIMACVTVDEAMAILLQHNLLVRTIESIIDKIDFYLQARVPETFVIGAVVFSNQYGLLGQTKAAERLINLIVQQEEEQS